MGDESIDYESEIISDVLSEERNEYYHNKEPKVIRIVEERIEFIKEFWVAKYVHEHRNFHLLKSFNKYDKRSRCKDASMAKYFGNPECLMNYHIVDYVEKYIYFLVQKCASILMRRLALVQRTNRDCLPDLIRIKSN